MTDYTWSDEEATKWATELEKHIEENPCAVCPGAQGRKVTMHMRGRPYMPYVEWHKAKSAELGWTTLSLAGCTNPGGFVCTGCGAGPRPTAVTDAEDHVPKRVY